MVAVDGSRTDILVVDCVTKPNNLGFASGYDSHQPRNQASLIGLHCRHGES